MRRAYALTGIFAIAAGTFTYACSDETEPGPADEQIDGGKDARGADREDPPASEGGSPRDGGADSDDADSGDASDSDGRDDAGDGSDGDAGDGGDADAEAGAPGHKVVVVRVGGLDGGKVAPAAAQVFLDEYDLGANTLVRTIPLPIQDNGDHRGLVQTAAPSVDREGAISLSADGHSVVVTGYTKYHDDGTPPWANRPLSENPRVVARVSADGSVNTTTLISDSFAQNYIGGAAISGDDVWIGGSASSGGPVQHLRFGNSVGGGSTTGNQIVAPWYAHNTLRIFDGQLYASTNDWKVVQVGTGLPTTGPQTETTVVENVNGVFEFELLDLDGQPGAERLYVALDNTGGPGGIPGSVRRYVYDKDLQTWSLSATFRDGLTTGVRGLAAYKDGENVIVLATTTEGDKLLRFVDNGGNTPPTPTVVATAPTGTMFRGVTHAAKP